MANANAETGEVAAYHNLWFKEHGWGCLAYVVTAISVFFATGFGLKALEMDKSSRGLLMIALLVIMIVTGFAELMRQSRTLTVARLHAMLPLLKLSETRRAYADSLIALHRSGRAQEEIEESMAALNALLDEEARLTRLLEHLAGRDLEAETPVLDGEAEDLARRIESSRDPVAKEAYAQSLSLLQERIDSLRSTDLGIERIQAHLALLRQAVFATRDAARRLAAAPSATTELATDALRAAVARAREQTTETERALAELRAI